MDWLGWVKQYTWSEEKTPYLVRVNRLSRSQARSELFVYTVYMTFLFPMLGIVLLKHAQENGDVLTWWLAVHALTVFGGSVLFGMSKNLRIAVYLASAPAAVFVILLFNLLSLELLQVEWILLLGFILLWQWYSLRIISMARAYPAMDGGEQEVRKDPSPPSDSASG